MVVCLRFWNGEATVRLLLAADEEVHVMLLERCLPGTSLRERPEAEQDVVIAEMLGRMWRRPPAAQAHPFRPLSLMLSHWSEEAERDMAGAGADRGLVREGIALFHFLAESGGTPGVLLATDLHAGNVLRSQREPWLAIDPKPFVGDAAYDATQHLLNCRERLLVEPERTIERFAGLLGVDAERVRRWTFARAAVLSGSGDKGETGQWKQLAQRLRGVGSL